MMIPVTTFATPSLSCKSPRQWSMSTTVIGLTKIYWKRRGLAPEDLSPRSHPAAIAEGPGRTLTKILILRTNLMKTSHLAGHHPEYPRNPRLPLPLSMLKVLRESQLRMKLRKSLENLRDSTSMTGSIESSLHVFMSCHLKLRVGTPNQKCHPHDGTLPREHALRKWKDFHETLP